MGPRGPHELAPSAHRLPRRDSTFRRHRRVRRPRPGRPGAGRASTHLGWGRRRLRPVPTDASQVGDSRQLRRLVQGGPSRWYFTSNRREAGGQRAGSTDFPGAGQQFLRPSRRVDADARPARRRRSARLRRRAPHRSAAGPLSAAAHGGRRHDPPERRGRRGARYLPAQGRLPDGRRLLGHGSVGTVGVRNRARASAGPVPNRRHLRAITRSCTRCTT